MTVDEVRSDVSTMLPDGSDLRPLLVAIQSVMRRIRGFRGGGWSFDLAFGTVELLPSQTAGTVSISDGSANLAGVGTSFDSPDHIGYKILLDGVEYEFLSQSDATTAILTTNYSAASNLSGASYTAFQNRYSLAADTGKIYRVWDQTNKRELRAEVMLQFESRHHMNQSSGEVARYSLSTRASNDAKRIIFRPYPTEEAKILYLYSTTYVQVTGPSSTVDIPDELDEALIQGVYARLLGLLTNHSPAAQMEQLRFSEMLNDAWKQDQDKTDLKFRFVRQNQGDAMALFALSRTDIVVGDA